MSINVTRSSMPDYEEYIEEIRGLWDSRWLTNMGARHIEFERQLRDYLGVDLLSLFTNGHLALEAVIASFDFPKGGEVITTPFTFVSTTHAIVRSGLTPVFCDIDPQDFTLDHTKLEELITDRTVAILPVHVYGNVCHVDEIAEIAAKHGGLKVIYDAAHTFGVRRLVRESDAQISARSLCDYGDASILSFHATKVFHTIEGGAAICHDMQQREHLDDIKNYGIRNPETCVLVGGNAKMSEFQAAMGICNLRHIAEEIARRQTVYEHYLGHISSADQMRVWHPQPDVVPNYAYLPVLFATGEMRDRVWEALKKNDIIARRYFYPLTSDLQCYGHLPHGTPIARDISSRVLTLPLYADLAKEDVDRICGIILSEMEQMH